jgi:hypothetical protein
MKINRMPPIVAAVAISLAVLGGGASAQSRASAAAATQSQQAMLQACDTEQKLAQVLQSGGAYTPEGCRKVPITRLDSQAGALCALDFATGNQGIIGEIRSAAVTTRWWVPCAELRSP